MPAHARRQIVGEDTAGVDHCIACSSLARRQAVNISITRSLEERRRFARSTRVPAPS
jgi:hypothetical protein